VIYLTLLISIKYKNMSSGFKTFLIFLGVLPMLFLIFILVFGGVGLGFLLAVAGLFGTIYSAAVISNNWKMALPQSSGKIFLYIVSIVIPWLYTIAFIANR